jgi:LTXXQ motif family protein
MLKIVTAGATALFMTVSTLTYAQAPSKDTKEVERLNEADVAAMTDARVNVIKSTLQLTADQEKLWPAVEDAIRARARDRQTRLANLQKEADELRGKSRVEILRDRNPIEFLNKRADALTQKAADLKKLAGAWQPLYQTLTPDQKRRMGHLAITTLRDLRNGPEHRRLQSENDEEED